MTKTQEIVNNGYKDNSMYEDHSVIGQATVEDMNIYYTKETNINYKRLAPNAMEV